MRFKYCECGCKGYESSPTGYWIFWDLGKKYYAVAGHGWAGRDLGCKPSYEEAQWLCQVDSGRSEGRSARSIPTPERGVTDMKRERMSRGQLAEMISEFSSGGRTERLNEAGPGPGAPGEWDMTAQDAGLYTALERFMEAASASHQASDGESPPTAEDAGMALKQLVSDWVDTFVQNTPGW